MGCQRVYKLAVGSALAAFFGCAGESHAATAAAAAKASAVVVRARDAGKVSTDDDDGYEAVARAVLRQSPPVPGDDDDEDGAAMLSDRAFRAVVAQRVRSARAQHRVMKDFMKRFSRNLKLSVLEDSKGDMPEAERQAAIKALKAGQDIQLSHQKQGHQEAPRHPPSHLPIRRPPPRHHHSGGGVHMLNGPLAGSATRAQQQVAEPGEEAAAMAAAEARQSNPQALLAMRRPSWRGVATDQRMLPLGEEGDPTGAHRLEAEQREEAAAAAMAAAEARQSNPQALLAMRRPSWRGVAMDQRMLPRGEEGDPTHRLEAEQREEAAAAAMAASEARQSGPQALLAMRRPSWRGAALDQRMLPRGGEDDPTSFGYTEDEDGAPSPLGPIGFGTLPAEEMEDAPPPRRWLAQRRPAKRSPPLLFAEEADEGEVRKPMKGWGNLWGSDRTDRRRKDDKDKDSAPRRSGLPLALTGLISLALAAAGAA